ncbi:hypothetical protein [Parahaliea aestuarii]|uniref:Uncharacterized protein n=1 Tax=Parahaliea aestuarii TaxID=1852021 RepID=A0A5C8ZMT7_9GAMM|nr:hypothetical protein [Parahaliea aestuarii]TXS88949.1 hypothetical protein FVW59_19355 [Parahaliea aestuarii]
MEAGDWISLFMALIASGSAAITYVVYRSATDPEVIVYADVDRKRPSIVNLIIKNIGKGPALDITFHSTRPLPAEAFSIDIPKDMPKQMVTGPIITGVPYLAPGQEIVLTWGQFGGLKKYLGDSSITVTSKYRRPKMLRPRSAYVFSDSKLDITQFEHSDASDHNWGPKLVKALEATNKELSAIKRSLQGGSNVSS